MLSSAVASPIIPKDEIESTVLQSVRDILSFARQNSQLEDLKNPTLTLLFPSAEKISGWLTSSLTARQGHLNDTVKQELIRMTSQAFRAYICPNRPTASPQHKLFWFGEHPQYVDDSYVDVTDEIRFELATHGAIQYFYESEYGAVNRAVVEVARQIQSPQIFRQNLEKGKWRTSTTLWMGWTQFKLRNDETISNLTKVILKSVAKLESLRLVVDYLKTYTPNPQDSESMSPEDIEESIHHRRNTADACMQAAEILSKCEDLETLRDAIACFAALHMVNVFEPPIPDTIQSHVDQILLLIQRLENEIIEPFLHIEREQKELEQVVVEEAYRLPSVIKSQVAQ